MLTDKTGVQMIRVIFAFLLVVVPNAAMACFACCYTYDLGHPAMFDLKDPKAYHYILGKVTKIEPHDQGDRLLVTINVLTDYRYPEGAKTVRVLANADKNCGPQIALGQYAKFGIDIRNQPPSLAFAPINAF